MFLSGKLPWPHEPEVLISRARVPEASSTDWKYLVGRPCPSHWLCFVQHCNIWGLFHVSLCSTLSSEGCAHCLPLFIEYPRRPSCHAFSAWHRNLRRPALGCSRRAACRRSRAPGALCMTSMGAGLSPSPCTAWRRGTNAAIPFIIL